MTGAQDGGASAWPAAFRGAPSVPRMPLAEPMTLRDHFAGLALQGLMACSAIGEDQETIASAAYSMADAMLAAREQK